MDDGLQAAEDNAVYGMRPDPAPLPRPEPSADRGTCADQPSIVPALAALAMSLVEMTAAAAAAITVFDGQNRWITVTHGPVEIDAETGLFPALLDACGAMLDRPTTVREPAQVQAVCGRTIRMAGSAPSRLDVLCVTGRGDASRGAICVIDAASNGPGDASVAPLRGLSPVAHLRGLSKVMMRLLDLHDQVEDYQHVLMLSPHMSCTISAGGTIVELADSLRTLLGIEAGSDLDRRFHALIHPDDEEALAEAWRQARAGEIPVEVDYRLRVRDKGYRWFHAHAKPRRDASGRVTRWCALLEDVHERREDALHLARLAYHDALTGLCNRACFRMAVQRRIAAAEQSALPPAFAVARLYLHEFRAMTGAFGHVIGDHLLLGASKRIGNGVRSCDLLAHGGRNEFFLLLDGVETAEQAMAVLDDILHVLRTPMQVDGSVVAVGASVGVTLASTGLDTDAVTSDADTLMQNAELALLRARTVGRGGCCFYSPDMDEKVRRIQALTVDMTCALGDQQFFLHYQPVLDARTGHVNGLEALVRWNHPTRGIVSPADFIPEAETNGLIVPIGEWVLQQVCREAATWPSHLRVGVNLSAVQVRAPGLVEIVAQALRQSGLDPARLILEITESVPLLGEADNVATLQALKALGLQIALDDFGTGYASLSYLQCYSFDSIKIERAFVRRMLDNEDARLILRAVIQLSRSLCRISVAEGVETTEQFDALREEGCDYVQGYLFSRPVEASAVPGIVQALDEQASGGRWSGRDAATPQGVIMSH